MAKKSQDVSAQEMLQAFMEAQALVAANTMFIAFCLGNLGAVSRVDATHARKQIAQLMNDADDLEDSAKNLANVVRKITSNVLTNIEKRGE